MRVLDLFSGIGGFSLGLERAGMRTVAFCEIEPFCQKVLKKHWPDVPIYNDVRTITKDYHGETIELICGGYPCQPFSVAGKRKGKDDDRHLWPAMLDCIKHFKPRWVIAENVAGHVNMGLDQVLSDLESEGYEWRTFLIPACALNAPHRRNRVWIVGYSKHNGLPTTKKQREFNQTSHNNEEGQVKTCESKRASGCEHNEILANTTSKRQSRQREFGKPMRTETQGKGETNIPKPIRIRDQWSIEPELGRVANGISNRVDRLKGLGNAVVPQIPEVIGKFIMEVEELNNG